MKDLSISAVDILAQHWLIGRTAVVYKLASSLHIKIVVIGFCNIFGFGLVQSSLVLVWLIQLGH